MNVEMAMLHALEAPPLLAAAASTCSSCNLIARCLCSQLNANELRRFEQLLTRNHRVPRNAALYRTEEASDKLYVVRYGTFKTVGIDSLGERYVNGFKMAGDLMGLDVIATGSHRFSAFALEDSEVCEISRAKLDDAMACLPTLLQNFHRIMSSEIVDGLVDAATRANMRADRRFATFLLALSARYAALGYSPKAFHLRMSRGDIGSYLGITVESLSRMIAKFKQSGWTSISRRTVEISDLAALEAFSRGENEHLFSARRIEYDTIWSEP
ncbi:MAG: helix-turn-helix domain-containing protein [Pseudomonadota bacterium]